MAARSKARKRAVDILFEADQRQVDPLALMTERSLAADPPLNPYVRDIVTGVVARQERVDELLATYSQGWTLARMPVVDRIVLRVGAWELLYNDSVPDAVAIDEAVEMVSVLSTDDSPGFVNGVLSRLLELKPVLAL
ncbi:MAG: transcription antitermination factor NusB [Actinomycetota bacterium]